MSDEATSEDWVRATAKMVGFDAEVADAAVARLGAAAQPAPAPPKSAQPVGSQERVAEAPEELRELADYCEQQAEGPVVNDLGEGKLIAYADIADRLKALLAAGVFREPQPECGAVDRTGRRRCVFTPGHHEVENWTSHGDRGGWTWNDQPASAVPSDR